MSGVNDDSHKGQVSYISTSKNQIQEWGGVYAHKKAFQKTRARKIMHEGRNYAKNTFSTKRNLENVSGDVTVPSTAANSL